MIADITWGKLTPPEMREMIEPIIDRYAWLIPPSIHELHIKYFDYSVDEKNVPTDHVASIRVEDDYRRAIMDIYSCWMDGDDRERRFNIIHELCHIHTSLPSNFYKRALSLAFPKDEDRGMGYAMAIDEGRRVTESATQDLAWIILNLEDSLAEQFGTDNITYNLTLFTEWNRLSRPRPTIQPKQSENDRSAAVEVLKGKAPALTKTASPVARAKAAARETVKKGVKIAKTTKGASMKPQAKAKA